MKKLMISKLALAVSVFMLVFYTSCQEKETEKITYVNLVNRLTDLEVLAQLPNEGEKSEMWASYDRRSKVDSITGEFINWAANNDGLNPQFIRKEGNNEVLAEMTGPGAIVRIWSASPRKGKVNIYIDGSETPMISESFIDYFKPTIPAFDFSELVYETNAKGFNNYVPITYQKSCKIVAEPGWGQYYHFNYITFKKGTEVEKFDPNLNEQTTGALTKVNTFFQQKMGENPSNNELTMSSQKTTLESGKRTIVFDLKGKGAIASLKAKVQTPNSKNIEEILRKTILEIAWDGEKNPSVWSPIGDFFGSAPGFNTYKTLPMGMVGDEMYSYWYMPFLKGAKITLHNYSDHPVDVTLEIGEDELQGDSDNYARFHAKWHRDLAPVEKARWPDWLLLKTEGKGRFLGASLSLWNPKGGSNTNAGEGHYWWGEGDEKFFIDGESFPSTFGTGTEDYFGYAWCDPSIFEQAFHSQSIDSDNMGYQSVNRWQIIDNIPFQKSFNGYLEKYFANDWPTQYATVVYWYLDADGKDPIKATPEDELFGYEIPFEVYRQPDALEAENLKVTKNTGGWVNTDAFAHESMYKDVSGHKMLFWGTDKNKKNNLVTEFNSDKEGRYDVYANIIKQKEGGVFKISINNQKLKNINFKSSNDTKYTERVKLGTVDLKKGRQEIIFDLLKKDKFPQKLWIDYFEFKKR
ncbi:glycoside hydrolase family 172 protein [uncultured Polaribacter sp.]|uniref:glycoside hydrolase family 172 protein n=1 Tax=uncultured Polaribacter sp. TaxID=174711 RepID=UPI002629F158|nr:glycoside hydrolase family 172 protein [uncultured Polaribacter sp.]